MWGLPENVSVGPSKGCHEGCQEKVFGSLPLNLGLKELPALHLPKAAKFPSLGSLAAGDGNLTLKPSATEGNDEWGEV